jgi:hypothetical protein
MSHLDYLSRGALYHICPAGSVHMKKVKGHHCLFYVPAVINSFFHSHPENTRKKEKGSGWLMEEGQQGSCRVPIESTHLQRD